ETSVDSSRIAADPSQSCAYFTDQSTMNVNGFLRSSLLARRPTSIQLDDPNFVRSILEGLMTKPTMVLAASLMIFSIVYAQSSGPTPLESMVETEKSFAKASFDHGTRESFLSFIAEDGVLFRPTAVKGKQWLLANPGPSGPKRSLLAWRPVFADISVAGDLGYTTGPWEFKTDINDEKPVAFGQFITVWRKQPNGAWKFVIDLGISHPQSTAPAFQFQSEANVQPDSKKTEVSSERETLLVRERELLDSVGSSGAGKAFQKFGAKSVRLFRENHTPFIGLEAASHALEQVGKNWAWETAFTAVSNSGDFGYSYGTYSLNMIEKGNYLRIWRRQNESWKVVVDVASPLPKN
ncbi:MAG TPA: nuclear transport factor 2 family protein, partial [Pyrinomonadaceae bacterium]|nr:nuclear transport factor 2 family protein [Pyrinomonadaceae bacterium]